MASRFRFKRTAIVGAAAVAAIAGSSTMYAFAASSFSISITDVRCVGTNRAEVSVATAGQRGSGRSLSWKTNWIENGRADTRSGSVGWVSSIQTFRVSVRNNYDLFTYIRASDGSILARDSRQRLRGCP